jgi:glutaminyl-peptide cyclotransferase
MENFFRLTAVFIFCGSLFLTGCSPQEEAVRFDGNRALAETEALLKISPRDAGTANARIAAVHLETRLKELGYKTVVDLFSEETSSGKMFFNNVLGRLPGETDRLIVLASHFDTKSGVVEDFQGANDSGSSCGVLLELARVLADEGPWKQDILVAFFDGEECRVEYGPFDGLHGSRYLARQIVSGGGAPLVDAVILLDMVGDKDLNITVPRNCSPKLVKDLFAAAKELGVRASFGLGEGAILDDHVPFALAGMPAIDIIDFEYGSAPGLNDYWHTPADTLDKLSAESMQIVGDTVLRMIENMQ